MSQQKNIKNQIFSDNLRCLMAEDNMTQVSLSKYLGVAQSAVSNYLNGVIPRTDILFKIGQCFDVTMEQLLTGDIKRGSLSAEVVQMACEKTEEEKKSGVKLEYMIGPSIPLNSQQSIPRPFPSQTTSSFPRVQDAINFLADQLGVDKMKLLDAAMAVVKNSMGGKS